MKKDETVEQKETKVEAAPPKEESSEILKRLAELEKRDQENQKTIQMLRDVADKGRVFSWESRQNKDKQPQRVKVAVVDGKYLVGWRTVKDELISDPRTGRTIGESQQYELLLKDAEGMTTKLVDGYLNFSNLRYESRVDCPVLSKSEDYSGKLTFRVGLPTGEEIELGSAFIN